MRVIKKKKRIRAHCTERRRWLSGGNTSLFVDLRLPTDGRRFRQLFEGYEFHGVSEKINSVRIDEMYIVLTGWLERSPGPSLRTFVPWLPPVVLF
jgi:hypothetical protein